MRDDAKERNGGTAPTRAAENGREAVVRLLLKKDAVVDAKVQRPFGERAYRWLLREGVSRPRVFGALYGMARSISWLLPKSLRDKIGVERPRGVWPTRTHPRKVLLLKGCVQPAMSPSITY